jgi:hypothetical protein
MENSDRSCLGCLSSLICPISIYADTSNDSIEHRPKQTPHPSNDGILDRHVAEQQQIASELTQNAQSIRELKHELHWLVKTCKAKPTDSRCARVWAEIDAYQCKTRVSNERYMEVKLLVDHQRYKQTMERRKRISTVMKRDKPLYALIQKEHDTFIDNVNEMEDLNIQMEEEFKERRPTSEGGHVDLTRRVESCVEEIESFSIQERTGERDSSSLYGIRENTEPLNLEDTMCISNIEPRYSQSRRPDECGLGAEIVDFSKMEASLIQE